MNRSLRPRKSQPNYAILSGANTSDSEGNLDDPGPSAPVPAIDDDDLSIGSDFAPEEKKVDDPEDDDKDEDEVMAAASDVDDIMDSDLQPVVVKSKPIPKPKPKAAPRVGGTRQKMYTLPTPSVHHRHRAVPLYSPTSDVERLVSKPGSPFEKTKMTLTHCFTHDPKTTDRVNKGWGYNVGPGPVWELVEDRGWFMEAKANAEFEADRRPLVYQGVKTAEVVLLSSSDATPYLPTDIVTADDGTLQPPPPITCFLGPHKSQNRVEFTMFDARINSEFIPESQAHLFHPGAPAWGLDWCPIHPSARAGRNYTQYLAVAPFPTKKHSPDVGVRARRPALACIQIWSCNLAGMRCETVLCIESGPAYDLKWCPLPSHNEKRFGFIAGTFEDGTFSVYAVPDLPRTDDRPTYVHLPEPILRIEMVETACWSFDWANSEVVAIGTTNGAIVVYNIGAYLKSYSPDKAVLTDMIPTHYIPVHQSAIRALTWIKVPPSTSSGMPSVNANPTVIASGGYDGMECMTDIREGRGSVMNRTRDVINTMMFCPYAGGPITIDHENIVKAYSASPSMLGRGHTLLEPGGPVWAVSTSDMHPQLGVACADGTLSTTNMLRSTRRGGSVPFWIHKIYQLDYSRKSGDFRMLERFLPTELAPTNKTGAWPREVGVQRVVWNSGNGLGCAGMVASSTGAGLCRVDVLEGRWMKDKFPYGDIECLRGAVDGETESE